MSQLLSKQVKEEEEEYQISIYHASSSTTPFTLLVRLKMPLNLITFKIIFKFVLLCSIMVRTTLGLSERYLGVNFNWEKFLFNCSQFMQRFIVRMIAQCHYR